MSRLRFWSTVVCLVCLGVAIGVAAPPPKTPPPAAQATDSLPVPPQEVVDHVSHSIAWYRRIVALQQLPVDADDVLPRERAYQTALTSLQVAFEFGRAAANLAGKKPAATSAADGAANSQDTGSSADQAAARMAQRITDLQSQLSALDRQIAAHASPKEKTALSAKRGEVTAALDLAKEIQGTIGQIQHFEATMESRSGGTSGGLAGQIEDLRRSVPELRTGARGWSASAPSAPPAASSSQSSSSGSGTPGGGGGSSASGSSTASGGSSTTAAHAAAAAVTAESFRPESAGVIALLGKWFSLEGSRRQLTDAMKQTDGLQKDLENIRARITKEARDLARQSLDSSAADPTQLLQSKQRFEQAATRFRQLSTLLIPLGEQGVTLDSASSILDEWRDSLSAKTATIARYLALRLLVLFGSIAVVLVISEVWRRATFRYLHDTRRRQQFLALRRVAVGLALTFVIVFGLVSEVGSLATYAGLITAGLAVALQNVILAVVAYFFLIGRYGVRIGDRITLAGVTGRVVEIGLVRIYLLELAGPQLRSTGRMIVLSNAVLFQPTALFKQMPGADFHWHTITLTLSATTDVEAAEKRVREAAESVYEKYRPAIEERHAALQRFIDFQTAMPAPEVYGRLTTKGLECTVRYPLEPAQAVITDQRMLAAIRQAQAKDPPLEVVDGPVLDTSES